MVTIKIKRKQDAKLPCYAYEGDAAVDLFANARIVLKPGHRVAVPTGIFLELPKGYVGLVKDRSGLALRYGLITLAGVIDSNYRGEVKVVLANISRKAYVIEKGMRIAQLLVLKAEKINFREVSELSKSEREDRGFGSSGIEILEAESKSKKTRAKKEKEVKSAKKLTKKSGKEIVKEIKKKI